MSMRKFDAVVFDMDGTLIEPLLDLAAMRRELGLEPTRKILPYIESLPPGPRRQATQRLLDMEMSAARKAELMPGARDTLRTIRGAGLKTALLTNNHRQAMETVLARFRLEFDLALSRESGPIKPEPGGILRACRQLGVSPARAAVVGDFRYDVEAARAAGAVSVLLVGEPAPPWAAEADYRIRCLSELPVVIGI